MQEALATKRAATVFAALCLAILVVRAFWVFVSVMMNGAYSPDDGWLLQTGRYILDHRAIPAHDLYSWTFPDREWVVYQWLFEAALALADRLLGIDGVVRLFMVAVAAIYVFAPVFADGSRRVPIFLTLICGAMALYIVSIAMSLRPVVATTLFLLAQYLIVRSFRRGKLGLAAAALLVAPLYAVWGNVHLGVTLGLVSLLLMLAGDALERRRLYTFAPVDPRIEADAAAAPAYGVLLAVAVAASLFNPHGPGIYGYIAELSLKESMNATIVELQSPNFHDGRMLMFLVFCAVFAALMSRANRVFAAHEILHLTVFTVATFYAARFVVWAALFYALILPKALYHQWAAVKDAHAILAAAVPAFDRARGAVLAVLGVFALGMLGVFPEAVQPFRFGPCASVAAGIEAYQSAKRASDRVFNDPLIGSCSIAQHPGTAVFIDTRFDFYDHGFVRKTRDALALRGDWNGFLSAWRVDTFLVSKTWPLASVLKNTGSPDIVYEDDAMIVVRNGE